MARSRYTSLGSACILRQYVPQAAEWMDKLPYMSLVPQGLVRDSAAVLVSGSLLWLGGIWGSRWGLSVSAETREGQGQD